MCKANSKRRVWWVVIFAALLCSPGTAKEQVLDEIVAYVADKVITKREFISALAQRRGILKKQNKEIPEENVLVGQVLQRLIVRKLQLHEAQRSGIFIDSQSLEKAIADIASRNRLTIAQMRQQIEQHGEDYESFRKKVQEDMLIGEVRQRKVIDKIEVSEAEISAVLRANDEQSEFHYSYLRVRYDKKDQPSQDKAKRLLAKVKNKVREGADFAALGEKISGGRRVQFKRTAWRDFSAIPQPIADRLVGKQVGEMLPIIKTSRYLYLVRLDGRKREGQTQTLQTQYRARHIVIQSNVVDTDALVCEKLQEIKQDLLKGADFSRLAKRHSQDPGSRYKGGELGWIDPAKMVPAFAEKVKSARVDAVVGPFRSQLGWHLLQVQEVREKDISFQTERLQIISQIRQQKAEAEIHAWLLRLREKYYVESVLRL